MAIVWKSPSLMDLEFHGNVSTLKPFNYRKIKFVRHLVLDHKTEKLQSFNETDKGRNKCLVQIYISS